MPATTTPTMTDQLIQDENDHIVQTYKRPPFVLVHGEGSTLFDSDGKPYQDWVAGIAVNALGYNHPAINDAIVKQTRRYIHVSNTFYQDTQIELADLLITASGFKKLFFTNSGTEGTASSGEPDIFDTY